MCQFEESDRQNISKALEKTARNTQCLIDLKELVNKIDNKLDKIIPVTDIKIDKQRKECNAIFIKELREIKEDIQKSNEARNILAPLTKMLRHVRENILVYIMAGIIALSIFYQELISKIK